MKGASLRGWQERNMARRVLAPHREKRRIATGPLAPRNDGQGVEAPRFAGVGKNSLSIAAQWFEGKNSLKCFAFVSVRMREHEADRGRFWPPRGKNTAPGVRGRFSPPKLRRDKAVENRYNKFTLKSESVERS